MKQSSLYLPIRRFRVFSACLLSLLMLMAPMAPLAASANRSAAAHAEKKTARQLANSAKKQLTPQEALESALFVNPPAPPGPIIGAAMSDSFSPDANSNNRADPGATVTYTAVISNTGSGDASNVSFTDTIDPNTTLVNGSLKISPLAFPDSYNTPQDAALDTAASSLPGVLANDTGTPAPTAVPIAAGSTAQPGGVVTLNADGSFTYNPPSGFNGTDTFTYTATNGQLPNDTATVTITVGPPDTPPTAVNDSATVNEDASATAIDVLTNDTNPDGGPKNIASVTQPTNGTVVPTGPVGAYTGLTYQPNANYCNNPPGTTLDTFTYTLNGGSIGTVTMTVTCVNDPPSFTKGADQTALEDSGAQTVNNWATAISAGGPDESGQTLTFVITNNTNAALFSAGPAVASDGTLTYTPAANANGSATITLKLTDNGGGTNESATQTFVINVTAVNDAPSFTKGADQTVNEDAGAQTVAGWATAISAGPANESGQTLTFVVTNNTNTGLFSAGPSVAANGTLTYTPAANANGSATITLKITDSGGTAGGGVDESPTQTFVINVTAVNDPPSFTKGLDQNVNEDAGAQTVVGWATAISAGPADESGQTLTFVITNNTNAGLFSAGPSVAANGTLTYTPAANANGTATITLKLTDNGGGTNESPTQSFVIMVGAVNDPPSFTKGADQTVNEDAGAQTVVGWATAISAGPPDESGQTLTFVITNNTNPGLFSAGPAVAANGTLTYTPAANANGSATITLKLTDSGGGTNESPTQSFVINVTAVNDAPVLTASGGSASFTEDGLAVAVDPGITVTDVDNATLASATVQITGNFQTAEDVLAFTNDGSTMGNVTAAAYVPATGLLTLTSAGSTATLAEWQSALRAVTYNNTSQNPNTTARTVSFKVNDGALNSNIATRGVTITAINDAPVLVNPASVNATEDTQFSFTGGNAISVTDVDSGAGTNFQATLSVTKGTINVTAGGATVLGNNTTSVTITGTVANVSTALGTVKYTGNSNFNGTDTLVVNVTDNGQTGTGPTGTDSKNITINVAAVNDPPLVTPPATFSAMANMKITGFGGLLASVSDTADNGVNGCVSTTFTVTSGSISATTPAGGTISNLDLNAGTFDFEPPPGATGNVTFTYTVTDSGCPGSAISAPATVTVNVSGPVIWFVDSTAPAAGNGTWTGTNAKAFQTVAQAAAVDASDHRIFVLNNSGSSINYANGVALNTGEWLIGQGVAGASFDIVMGISPPSGTVARPTVGGVRPTLQGTVTVNTQSASNVVKLLGFNLSTGASDALSNAGTTINGVTADLGSVTTGTGTAVNITGSSNGSTAANSFTFISISANGAPNGIVMTNSVGTFTVNGTGTTDGSGGTIQNITNRGASFVNASSGLTVTLKNMVFNDVGTTNGADPTVAAGGCGDLVTGNNLSCNAGIHLVQIATATLDNIDMNNDNAGSSAGQIGINGNNVTNFTLNNSNVLNFGNEVREHGLKFFNMLGTSAITNSTITGNETDQVHVQNSSGTLTKLDIKDSTIGTSAAPNGQHGIVFNAHGTAQMKLQVQGVTLSNVFSNCIDSGADGTRAAGTGGLDVVINGSATALANKNSFTGCGASPINLVQDGSTDVRFNITNNGTLASPTFLVGGGSVSHSININQAGNAPQSAVMQGSITNNFIGNSSGSHSANTGGDAIRVLSVAPGTLTVLISGNTTQGSGSNGINVQMSEDTNAAHRLNATILNNSAKVTDINSFDAIRVVAGATSPDAGILCAEINNNKGTSDAGNDFTVRQRFSTTFQLRAYTGVSTDTAAVQTHLDVSQANDPLGLGNDWFITTQAPGGGFTNTAGPGNQCPQPTTPVLTQLNLTNPFRDDHRIEVATNTTAPKPAPRQINSPALQNIAVDARAGLAPLAKAVRSAVSKPAATVVQSSVARSATAKQPLAKNKRATMAFANHVASRSSKIRTDASKAPTPLAPIPPSMFPANIGTLPAGKSVTITFQVTLNNAMPSGTSQVSNQGTVHYAEDAGGVAGPGVPTDDPDTGAAGDATITPIDAPTAADSSVSGQILDSNGNPVEGAAVRMTGTQNRLTVTDAQGNYHFDNVETNGFYTVVPTRANFTFSPTQRAFSQLGQTTDAAFNATPTGSALNPLDTTEYFVRQQYVDFLGREPDESGLNFWVNNIESCVDDANCRAAKRIDTSAAFFLSIEFQQTGYLVYRMYRSAYGDMPGSPVPLRLNEFRPDTAQISNGVVVLKSGWEAALENNKQAFAAEFVQRARFTAAYPGTMTPSEFVNKLFTTAGVTPSDSDRSPAIGEFGSAATSADAAARGRALRRVAENSVLARQEFNQAFVLMQYFGYLQRDANSRPDTDFTGYNFWLDKLNTFGGNFQNAEMVRAFLVSTEYRGRFPR